MTAIEQIEDMIVADLTANVPGIVTCGTWQGEIADLLKQPQRMPAVWVVYGGAKFGERTAIGQNAARAEERWTVTIIVKSLRRGRTDGARGAYDLLDAVRSRLQGMRLEPMSGHLWPVREDLVSIGRGLYAYGQEYRRVVND